MNRTIILGAASLALAGGTGFFVSKAVGIGTQAPAETVTVNVGQGPPGPKGDPGSPGAESCPAGSKFTAVLLNAPGGQTEIWTCVKS